jgi:hypothetical protein
MFGLTFTNFPLHVVGSAIWTRDGVQLCTLANVWLANDLAARINRDEMSKSAVTAARPMRPRGLNGTVAVFTDTL